VTGDQDHARGREIDSPRCACPDPELDAETLGDHIDRLYRAAQSLCASPQDAEDLVQETFARVLKKPRRLRSGNDVSYLLTVLRNTFLSTRRAAARRPQSSDIVVSIELLEDPRAGSPEDLIQAGEVYRAIAALPPDFRDAVAAIDLVGLSYREAATALQVRKATITTRLHRGRQRIARALSGSVPGPPTRAVPRRSDSAPIAGSNDLARRNRLLDHLRLPGTGRGLMSQADAAAGTNAIHR
jgi:RNA polymerase sigma-70 factor, ECF subfamily